MHVTVGMSGGVDSSVAAALLRRDGHAVSGVFMHNWDDTEPDSGCHAEADRKDALAVCARLGIPFRSVDFTAEYREQVFAHFLAEYRAGRTPNPDVLCNREIKFGCLLDAAYSGGADKLATGHYAQVVHDAAGWKLLRARDRSKDQTYFLHLLDQRQLAAALFPLGGLLKREVRALAAAAGLPVAAKKDSTGICFIGERDFRAFLAHYLPTRRGEIRTPEGHCIGEHAGALYYTPGQRAGLHVGGRADGNGSAWYVVAKDVSANVVYAAQGHDNPWLQSHVVGTGAAHWIAGAPPAADFDCAAMTRYRQPEQACHVSTDGERCEVRFEAAQWAVAPGQSVVFYRGDECLGGAVIEATDAPRPRAPA